MRWSIGKRIKRINTAVFQKPPKIIMGGVIPAEAGICLLLEIYLLHNIFKGKELSKNSAVANFATAQHDGEVAEWLKAAVSKTVIPGFWDRGFKSLPLRHPPKIFHKNFGG